jgi:hypothetical protein
MRLAIACLALAALAAAAAARRPPPPSAPLPGGIPRVIHQSWRTADVPRQVDAWRASWARLHPGWRLRLWTDADNRALVLASYPWLLDTYDALPAAVMRADVARLLYMHHVGGMYADLDFRALKPFDPLLAPATGAVVGAMVGDDWDQALPNAWLASPPGADFWLFALHHVVKMAGAFALHGAARCAVPPRWDWLEGTTGPAMLFHAAAAYKAAGRSNLTILAPGVVYPVDWRATQWGQGPGKPADEWSACRPDHAGWDEAACVAKFPGAYAVTYWAHTWGPAGDGR